MTPKRPRDRNQLPRAGAVFFGPSRVSRRPTYQHPRSAVGSFTSPTYSGIAERISRRFDHALAPKIYKLASLLGWTTLQLSHQNKEGRVRVRK
jgi:hypothetical protein